MTRIKPPSEYRQGDINLRALESHLERGDEPLQFYLVGNGLNVLSENYGPTMVGVYRKETA